MKLIRMELNTGELKLMLTALESLKRIVTSPELNELRQKVESHLNAAETVKELEKKDIQKLADGYENAWFIEDFNFETKLNNEKACIDIYAKETIELKDKIYLKGQLITSISYAEFSQSKELH